jgi:hypothetical protein
MNNGSARAAAAHNPVEAWYRRVLLPTIGRFVGAQVKPLRERIEALETKIAGFEYCGVWRSGVTFKRGNFVTHDGSVWHCNCDTCVKPGTDPVAWSLAIKRERMRNDYRRQRGEPR